MRRRTIPVLWVWALALIGIAIVVAIAWRPLTTTVDLQLPTLVVVP